MVDITSLKARLARLRLSSNIAEEAKHDRRLEDPVTTERKKKKQKKAAQDPYNEYTKNTGGKRKKKNKLTRSDQKRGKRTKKWSFDDETKSLERDLDVITSPADYDATVKEIDERATYKKKYGEDPVDRKRKLNKKRTNQTKKATQDLGYGDYTKNTGGKRKKKNKLTRSDQKRGKKQDLVADENRRNTKLQKKKKKKKIPRESDANVSLRERESPGVSQKTWDELDQYPEFMSDPTT